MTKQIDIKIDARVFVEAFLWEHKSYESCNPIIIIFDTSSFSFILLFFVKLVKSYMKEISSSLMTSFARPYNWKKISSECQIPVSENHLIWIVAYWFEKYYIYTISSSYYNTMKFNHIVWNFSEEISAICCRCF